MRNFLTFVALALVSALTVALIAPPFIDWSARREMVARAISRRAGEPVRISGPIRLRLLPTPYLLVEDVAFGRREAPRLTARAIRFEFVLADLLAGQIAVEDARFDRAELHLGPNWAATAEAGFSFGHVHAEHAKIVLARPRGAPVRLDDLTFDGAAEGPRGPWRGEGDFALGAERAHYRFAGEPIEGNAAPIRAEIAYGAARAELTGSLKLAGPPAFAGKATLSGRAAEGAWRIAGDLAADGEGARIDTAEARLGEGARAVEASGALAFAYADGLALDADLEAKTLDLDALLRGPKETFAPPARLAGRLAGLSPGRDSPLTRLRLSLRAEAAYLGARALAQPQLTLSGAAGAPMRVKLSSGLPGRGRVALDGAVEPEPAPVFRGRAEGEAGDFASLAAWIAEGEPALGRRLEALAAALPPGGLAAAANLELSGEGYAARALKLDAGASRYSGDVIYRLPRAGERGRLFVDLTTPSLDIDAAPNVEAGLAWLGDADLDLRVEADALRVARLGLASAHGGSLTLRALKEGDAFTLKQFALADLGGASISAEGASSPTERRLKATLDAERLGDFAGLLARAAPGAATQWLLRRADDLGPAHLSFEARREGPALKGPFPFDFLKSEGALAGARYALKLSQAPAPVDAIAAEATAASPDIGALARKFGLDIAPGPAAAGEVSLSGSGRWDSGFDAKARVRIAGAEANWSGTIREGAAAGALNVKGADLAPALAALGLGGAGAPTPADLSAEIEAGPQGGKATRLAGTLAGARLSGALSYAPQAGVEGALSLDRASLSGLLSLVLGRAAAPPRGAVWSAAKFAPALLTPPRLDLALDVGALDLGFAVGRAAKARLRLDRYGLALADASARVNGGEASGRLDIRRGDGQATVSGALALRDVSWDRPGLGARLDADLDFAGAGDSPAALASSLAGDGKLKIETAKIARLDGQALARVYRRLAQTESPPPDARRLQSLIGAELDRAPLLVAGAQGPLALSSGALRFGPLKSGEATLSGALDLTRMALNVEAGETFTKPGRYWSGAPPQVSVAVGFDPPSRQIEAEFLSAGLAAEALARETQRLQNFEADVRERAMFNRQRKAWRFLDRRKAEIAAFEADEARRALMKLYLAPYAEWAASHAAPAPPSPPKGAAGL